MTSVHTIQPGQEAPRLQVPKTNQQIFDLAIHEPKHFTLLIFYRGLHCPICKKYLQSLQEKLPKFEEQGTEVIAISMDDEERGLLAQTRWELEKLTLCYGLSEESAKAWGLYLSQGIEKQDADVTEPSIFNEPGVFLVRSDNTLYSAWIQSVPFARPSVDDLAEAVDFVLDNSYPPRGTFEAQNKAA